LQNPAVPAAGLFTITAVSHHYRTGHIRGKIGSEEDCRTDNVLGRSGTAERGVIKKDLHEFRIGGAYFFIKRRLDEAGTDRIDADPILAEFGCKCAGESEHTVL
jgi:hypothetical protein